MTRHTDRTLPLDPDVIGCLVEVMDPEIGLGVVDLSLVYQATMASWRSSEAWSSAAARQEGCPSRRTLRGDTDR